MAATMTQTETKTETKTLDDFELMKSLRQTYRPDPIYQAEYDRIDNEDPNVKCQRYGLKYDPQDPNIPRRLFFGTMMADESWDVFAMHAIESYGVYAKMALVESNTTHMANPRELRFGSGSNMKHELMSGMFGPNTDVDIDYFLEKAEGAIWMNRDSIQRDLIRHRWIQQGMQPHDVGIMSDVDEIWSRDFLRAAQICVMPKLDQTDQSCKMPKIVSACLQFEASPKCIKKKPWFHPDMISGHCIDGIGDPTERVVPLRTFERTQGERAQSYGAYNMENYPDFVKNELKRYPLYSAPDIRTVHGDDGRPMNYADMTGDGNTHAWGTAFHFHNWFHDFGTLRNKYLTYAHGDNKIYQKTLSAASEDMDIMVRCAKNLPNSANPRKDMREYYTKEVDGPKPIAFLNKTYVKLRHEQVVAAVLGDEEKYGSSYDKDGNWIGELDFKPQEKEEKSKPKPMSHHGGLGEDRKKGDKDRKLKEDDFNKAKSPDAEKAEQRRKELRTQFRNEPLPADKLNDKDESEFATVMGLATGLSIFDFKRFVGSLRKSGYKGNIIFGVNENLPDDVKEYFERRQVTAKPIRKTNCTYEPFVLEEHEKNLGLEVCGEPYPNVKMRWLKFPLGRDWLKECGEKCSGPVLIADVRDVYFQANPFGKGEPKVQGLQIFEEHPDSRTDHWLVDWPVGDCKGRDKTFVKPMLCSGTIIGTHDDMLKYLDIIYEEMKVWITTPQCRFKTYADDQSIHNWLFYDNKLPFAKAIHNREGVVHTVGYETDRIRRLHVKDYMELLGVTEDRANHISFRGSTDKNWLGIEEFGLTDEEGYFTNYDGTRSPIIHQWDRTGFPFTRWMGEQEFLQD